MNQTEDGVPTGFYGGAFLDTPYTREGINIMLFGQFGAPYYLVPVEIEVIELDTSSKGLGSLNQKDVIQVVCT